MALNQVNCRTAPKLEKFNFKFHVTDKETNIQHEANYSQAVAAGENIPKQFVGFMLDSLIEGELTPQSGYIVVSSLVLLLDLKKKIAKDLICYDCISMKNIVASTTNSHLTSVFN